MKNKLLLFVSLLAISIGFFACEKQENDITQPPVNNDPVYQGAYAVAPDLTKRLEQSKGIEMYELTMEPGDTLPWHEHPPHTFYVLEEGTLEVIFEDSTKTSLFYPKGQTNFGKPTVEMAINTGQTTIKILIHDIYYLDPDESNDPPYSLLGGAHIVAQDLTKILQFHRGIIMYELTMEPGDTLPWHSHPHHTFYVLEEGTLEVVFGNGSTKASFYSKGQTNFGMPFSDMAINTGQTTIKVLLHEFYTVE